ncbi:MAG TPA: trimeric intracellular cation channel family protein, partial [Flavitalea sp.]|nr:trimeric intracellular cation channel family protein [Flavitalea sp.]
MKFDFLRLIDILGTVSFAISGVFAAMQKRLDVFGILVIAFITALGGGTLRDILIGDLPVRWMRNREAAAIITLSTLAAIVFQKTFQNLQKTLLVFDSLGLGFFTVLGIHIGISHGMDPVICIALGVITGCFGGVIRDIALNNIPLIFQQEIYATACIFGALVYFMLVYVIHDPYLVDVISIIVICLVR